MPLKTNQSTNQQLLEVNISLKPKMTLKKKR